MTKIIQKIEMLKYGYAPNEFLPIKVDGRLQNRNEFLLYKARCLIVKRTLV